MTPEEARRLLDGTTPGPWIPSRSGYIGSAAGVMIHDGHVLGDTDADTCLIAAAPTLAAMIAGMRTEYMALNRADEDGEWHQVTPWSPEWPFRTGHTPDPRFDKVIRRYVTTPEEA